MGRGIFITFEGPEGSGKSTHIQLLAEHLRQQGYRVTVTREPGGNRLAAGLRTLLLDKEEGMSALAELFLYEADRAQHLHEMVLPELQKGSLVLCDRYTDSTLAYQGYGRGLDLKSVKALNAIASHGKKPDLTLLLDVPVERGLRQAKRKKRRHDRLEKAGIPFHRRVRTGFLALAKQEPRRFRVIPQQKDIVETQRQVRVAVDRFLNQRGKHGV